MREITDPELIAQLEAAPFDNRREVTDSNLLAQLEGQKGGANPKNWISRGLADVATGIAQGGQSLRNAPYNITRTFAPKTAEMLAGGPIGRRLFAPDTNNIGGAFGVNDPNILDKLLQGAASYGPLAAATGGGSLAGVMRGGAVSGGLLSENPMLGAAMGAGLGAVGKAIPAGFSLLKSGIRPAKTLKSLQGQYSEEAIKPIIEKGIGEYTSSIGKFKNEPFTDVLKFKSALGEGADFIGPKINKFGKRLVENPNLDNADLLKRKINEEVFDLLGKRAIGDTTVGDRLSVLQDLKELLKESTVSSLAQKSPKAAEDYLAADVNWAENVHPVRVLSSIFKNMSHRLDYDSKEGVKRAIEAIQKEYIQNPKNIPSKAIETVGKMTKQYKNVKTLQQALKWGAVPAAAGIVGAEPIKKLIHLLPGL